MNSMYKPVCDQLLNGFSTLKSSYKWDNDLTKWLISVAYAVKNKPLNVEDIDLIKEYIKKNTGVFSPFRSTSLLTLSGLLCLDNLEPKVSFDIMNDNYNTLKKAGFKQTSYLPIALYTLNQLYEGSNYSSYADQAIEIYKEMKSNHPILTSGDDYALAILLINERSKLDKIEVLYKALKSSGFKVANGLQMMSHILTFSDEPVKVLVDRCSRINESLIHNKLKVYPDYYASIAILALTGVESALSDLIEVALYIKSNKQAKWLSKGMLVMLASAIVTSMLIENADDELIITSLKVSIQVVIMAQQAAMIAAISASTAAAASSG
ncbi:MAG: DUF4003 family protein [Acidaminobacteraceae bacterium]